ncbi:MAG: RNA polymerase sigma factor [Myxococcales bacterium]|nr:RNA polymerase sigma factor [Myxococcales bacterium]MCB9717390.1 RNA polymerase sigma factor [Myxococcales bacterium]
MDTPQLDPIYRKLHHMVFLRALKILRDEEAARDMVQEAFLRVLRHLPKLEDKKDPAGWIRRIVTNLCLDELRKRRTTMQVGGETISDVPAPANPEFEPAYACENRELRGLLQESLDTLSPAHLQLFLMRETEGMTYAEMAEQVDCPPGTVMSRLFHARKKLQTHLRRSMQHGSAQHRAQSLRVPAHVLAARHRPPMMEAEHATW